MLLEGESTAGIPVVGNEMRGRGQSKRLMVLDSYRALAILAVLAYHYTVRWPLPVDAFWHMTPMEKLSKFELFHYGRFGVEFFFVISGFVILMTLERCRNPADFLVRRIARLWPALAVAATLTVFTMFLIGPPEFQASIFDYVTSLSLLDPSITSRVLHLPDIKWVDGAYWSLWVEIRFYAVACILYLLARRNFILAWFPMLAIAILALIPGQSALLGHLKSAFGILAPDYISFFSLGICAYEIYSAGRLKRIAMVFAIISILTMAYSAYFQLGAYQNGSAVPNLLVTCVIVLLFLLFMAAHPITRWFEWRPLVLLGQASYSLYLIHQFIGISIIRHAMALGIPYLVAAAGTVTLVCALALVIFRFVEVPAKTLILRNTQGIVAANARHLPWLNFQDR